MLPRSEASVPRPWILVVVLVASTVVPWIAGCTEEPSPEPPPKGPVPYKLHYDDEAIRVEFQRPPSSIRALKMAPPRLEPELRRGRWVVLAFGVFSMPDIHCIDVATSVILEKDWGVKLGIRPFRLYQEARTWFPEVDESPASPYWVLLEDGKAVKWATGALTEELFREFLGTRQTGYILLTPP